MLSQLYTTSTIPALEAVVHFAQARHGVLAGNIANLDTPGYQVRDLSLSEFQQRLKAALEAAREEPEPWSPGMLESRPGDPLRDVHESMKHLLFHDGSNVGVEQQVLALTKNQFLHNLAITVMGSQFRLLQTAISERV